VGEMCNFVGQKVKGEKTKAILDEFKSMYIDEKYPEKILFSNHLKAKPKIKELAELRNIMPKYKNLYYYDERSKELFYSCYEEICQYVEELEPWDEVDGLIFDNDMKWLVVINHEDVILTVGI
jgi:hypothetical protein